MQSLGGKNGVKEIVKNYGLVIVDECHHVPALMFEQVLKAVNAKYVYGLTATPVRADGGLKTLNRIFSELCVSKNRNKLIVDDVVKTVDCGRMPIVLTERSEHAKLLTDEIEKRSVKVFLLVGKESAKLKREKLAEIAAAKPLEPLCDCSDRSICGRRLRFRETGHAVFGYAYFVERKTDTIRGTASPRLCG